MADEEGEDDEEDSSSSSGGEEGGSPSSSASASSSRRPRAGPRPPSYASEDGVSYVIEARPRSTVVPLGPEVVPMSMAAAPPPLPSPLPVHPSEVGRVGRAPSR